MYIVINGIGKYRIALEDGKFYEVAKCLYYSPVMVPLEFDSYQEAKEWLVNYQKENTWVKVESPQ